MINNHMTESENIEPIWNQFSSGLKSFIISRVKNESVSSDILQEVFLKIHDNIHNLKDSSKVKPWIYQITRNLIIDHFRAENQSLKNTEIQRELMSSSSSSKVMETAIKDMIIMMDELSPEYCEALCMTEIEGMSQKEYAEMKGISYSGAKSRVQRARIILREMLLKCCHYQFDRYGTVFEIGSKCNCCCNS